MKRFFLLLSILLLGGCTGPSGKEISGIGVAVAPSMILITILVIPLISKITRFKRIKLRESFFGVNLILLASSFFIVFAFILEDKEIAKHLVVSMPAAFLLIPYIVLMALALFAFIEDKYKNLFSVFIISLYYLLVFGSLVFDNELALLLLTPILGFFVSIPLVIGLIVYIRKKEI
jgi:hypothetical protein